MANPPRVPRFAGPRPPAPTRPHSPLPVPGSAGKRPERSIATGTPVGTTQGSSSNKAEASTYITKSSGTDVLYDGSRLWAKITLELETGGPVAAGFKQSLQPVLGGAGVLLETGVPTEFIVSKGNQLFIAAQTVSRVKFRIESLPWLEQIAGMVGVVADGIQALVRRALGGGQ